MITYIKVNSLSKIAMAAIENMATIISALILIKLLFIVFNPKSWMNMSEGLFKNKGFATILALLIAGISGYYVFQNYSIVDFMAMLLPFVGLFMLSFIPIYKDLIGPAKKLMSDKSKMWSSYWLPILIWGVLSIYALYVMYIA